MVEDVWHGVQRRSPGAFDGPLVRLRDVAFDGANLDLRVCETSYAWFQATNRCWAHIVAGTIRRLGLGAVESQQPMDLANSLLANPLSVDVLIWATDRQGDVHIALAERNVAAVASGHFKLHLPAGGFVDPLADILAATAELSPHLTAAREAREELWFVPEALLPSPGDVTLHALARDLADTYEPFFSASVELQGNPNDFRAVTAGPPDAESTGVHWVGGSARAVVRWMTSNAIEVRDFLPSAWCTLLIWLVDREGEAAVAAALAALQSEPHERRSW